MPLRTFTPDRQRRNVAVLAFAQALFMSIQGMGIAATPLAAHTLLGADEKWLATLPIFLVHLSIMGTTIPASLLMGVLGRRAGFTLGSVLGIAAGGVGCYAMFEQSFPLLCLAAVFQGMQAGFFWYFRLAAADAAEPAFRAKAISLVMAGGVIAGFLGPQTAKWAVDWLAPVTFAGIYVAMAVFSVAVMELVQLVRIPRLSVAERAAGGRPMRQIMRQPAYRVALAASVFGYAVMTLTMSATPLAMQACGFGFADSATVIQGHIIAMFLPSFFTGHLINRFGVLPVIAAGGLIEVGCAIVNLSGVEFANFLHRQHPGRARLEFRLRRRLDAAHHHLCAGRAGQGAGEPRLHGLPGDRIGGGPVRPVAGEGRLDHPQPLRAAADGHGGHGGGVADAAPASNGDGAGRIAGRLHGRPLRQKPAQGSPPGAARPEAALRDPESGACPRPPASATTRARRWRRRPTPSCAGAGARCTRKPGRTRRCRS